ncbi:MAG: Rieske 2Fe-2S domain-containing protein [Zoogloeaceae bacterium]|nr:Rieske 2Fe-2S domain-containing protein [Zoogloeaceae bacterium]
MADGSRLICASADLEDGGTGVRFDIDWFGEPATAFVIRFRGQVRAFLNRCAHVPVELDWQEGAFFDADQRFLICATHGAMYEPLTGACVLGPCKGRRLVPVPVEEVAGLVYVLPAG